MQPIQLPVTQVGLEQSIEAAMRKAGRTSQINLGGSSRQINAISQPLGRITGQADEFAKSMEAANARVLAFGASVGILASVSRAMQGLVTSTIEVEKSLVSINSVLGVSGAELEKFGQRIFDVARNTGQTFDIVAKGALELSRQGLSAEDTLKRLNDALILSRLSGLDAEKSVEGLTAAFNSFSDTGITTEQILNKLVTVSQKFAVSEKDLVEGLKRSASVADQAGVSFDELIAIITAVQERTARGGAVIGNSFKTIFARIQDKAVLSDLQDIGVQVTDLQGKMLPATTILQNLSKEMDNLSQVEQADLAKKLGGVFQLSNLLAALKDLNSENSKYTQALETSQRAADEAYKKNAVLNETLASLINRVQVSAQQLGATLGAIGVTDNLKNILSFFSGLLESVQKVLGEESALGGFLRGLAKGIGNLIAGPGLALFGAIILKLSKDLVQFGFASLKSFFGIGRAAKEIKDVESSIQQILARNVDLQQKLFSLEGNRAAQLRLITDALVQQEALLRRSANTASSLAPALYGAGARGTSSGLRINPPNAAGGYIPAVSQEKQSISKGVGGARSGDKPVVIPNFNFGGGKKGPMVAHTGEYIVPNFAGKGSAVFNRDMVRSMGLPSGAKKINSAGGYIPNFVGDGFEEKFGLKRSTVEREWNAFSKTYPQAPNLRNAFLSDTNTVQAYLQWRKSGEVSIQKTRAKEQSLLETLPQSKRQAKFGFIYPSNQPVVQTKSLKVLGEDTAVKFLGVTAEPSDFLYKEVRSSAIKIAKEYAKNIGIRPDVVDENKFESILNQTFNEGSLQSFAGTIFESALQGSIGLAPSSATQGFDIPNKGIMSSLASAFSKISSKNKNQQLSAELSTLDKGDFKNALNDSNINSLINKIINDRAQVSSLNKAPVKKTANAARGYVPNFASPNAIAAMQRLLSDPAATQGEKANARKFLSKFRAGYSFGSTALKGRPISLRQVFDQLDGEVGISQLIDAAYASAGPTASIENVFSKFQQQTLLNPKKLRDLVSKKGYIPNFADPLKEAIGREILAGVPASQIYIDKSASLKNAMNPMGLMVANRRDEPAGGFQGINRARREGANPMMYGAASGFVPNYANSGPGTMVSATGTSTGVSRQPSNTVSNPDPELQAASRDFLGTIFAVQAGLSVLSGAFQDATTGVGRFVSAITNALSTATSVVFAGQGLSQALGGAKTTLGKAVNQIGILGAVAAGAYGIWKEYIKYQNDNNKALQQASASLLKVGEAANDAFINLQQLSEPEKKQFKAEAEKTVAEARKIPTEGKVGIRESLLAAVILNGPNQNIPNANVPSKNQIKIANEILETTTASFGGLGDELKNQLVTAISEADAAGVFSQDLKDELNKLFESQGILTEAEAQNFANTLTDKIRSSIDLKASLKELDLKPTEGLGKQLITGNEADFAKQLKNSFAEIRKVATDAGIEEKDINRVLIQLRKELIKQEQTYNEEKSSGVVVSKTELKNTINRIKIEQDLRSQLNKVRDDGNKAQIQADLKMSQIRVNSMLSETEKSRALAEQQLLLDNQLASLQLQSKELESIAEAANKISEIPGFMSEDKPEAIKQIQDAIAKVSKDTNIGTVQELTVAGLESRGVNTANPIFQQPAILQQILKFAKEISSETEKQKNENESIADLKARQNQITQDEARILENNSRIFDKVKGSINAIAESRSMQAERLGNQNQIIEAQSKLRLAELEQRKGQFSTSDFAKEQRKISDESFRRQLQNEAEQQRLEIEANLIRNTIIKENIFALNSNNQELRRNTDALLKRAAEENGLGFSNNTMPVSGYDNEHLRKLIAAEVGGQGQDAQAAFLATILNRARYRGVGIDTISQDSRYYAPLKNQEKFARTSSISQQAFEALFKNPNIHLPFLHNVTGANNQDGMQLLQNAGIQNLESYKRSGRAKEIGGEIFYTKPGENIVDSTSQKNIFASSQSFIEQQLEQAKKLALLADPSVITKKAQEFADSFELTAEEAKLVTENITRAAIDLKKSKESNLNKISINDFEKRAFEIGNRPQSSALKQINQLNEDILTVKEAPSTFQEGMSIAFKQMELDSLNFASKIGQDIPKMFADGMSNAIMSAIEGTSSLKDALRSAAYEFLKSINSQLINQFANKAITSVQGFMGFASGGQVKGGSGMKDDVPAMLMGGEFVINKKSVQKYGPQFLSAINSGSIKGYANGGLIQKGPQGNFYTPGTFGQGAIEGKRNLLDFATQTGTTGKFDRIINEEGFASIALEPESSRLSVSGMRNNPAFQATQSAKQEAFNLYLQQYNQEREAKKQEEEAKKAFKKQLLFTIGSLAVSAVASSGAAGFASAAKAAAGTGASTGGQLLAGAKGIFTGGSIGRQNTGGLFNLFSGAGKTLSGNFREGVNLMKLSRIGNADQLAQAMQADSSFADFIGSRGGAVLPALSASTASKGTFNWTNKGNGILSPQSSNLDLIDRGMLPNPLNWNRPNRATGGVIPETSGIDTVPAMLSGGEFIMNRAAVQNIGTGNLQAMNSGAKSVVTEEQSKEFNEKLVSKLDELIEVSGSKGDITINVSGTGNGSQEQTSSQDPSSSRQQLARQIKDAVLQVIEDEKRLGGQLRRR